MAAGTHGLSLSAPALAEQAQQKEAASEHAVVRPRADRGHRRRARADPGRRCSPRVRGRTVGRDRAPAPPCRASRELAGGRGAAAGPEVSEPVQPAPPPPEPEIRRRASSRRRRLSARSRPPRRRPSRRRRASSRRRRARSAAARAAAPGGARAPLAAVAPGAARAGPAAGSRRRRTAGRGARAPAPAARGRRGRADHAAVDGSAGGAAVPPSAEAPEPQLPAGGAGPPVRPRRAVAGRGRRVVDLRDRLEGRLPEGELPRDGRRAGRREAAPLGESAAVRWALMGEPEPPTPELAVRVRALVETL